MLITISDKYIIHHQSLEVKRGFKQCWIGVDKLILYKDTGPYDYRHVSQKPMHVKMMPIDRIKRSLDTSLDQ